MKKNDDINEPLSEADAKRLKELLRSAAPDVPSRRMWKAIEARIQVEPQPGFFERLGALLSAPGMKLGVAGMAAAMFLVIGIQVAKKTPPAEMASSESKPAPAPSSVGASQRLALPQPASQAGRAVGSPLRDRPAAAKSAAPAEPTEVERALADQDLDEVIAAMLKARQDQKAPMMVRSRSASGQPALSAQNVGYPSAAPAAAGGSRMEAYEAAAPAEAPSAPISRVDESGFWDFHPAALALNRRDWRSAGVELRAAASSAPEASERAFAQSALQLLSQAGQPVSPAGLGQEASLNVLSSGLWQVYVDRRVARYSGGVTARMAGLRSEGQELLLDMNFDRASFSPGTRFVRLAGDESSSVRSSSGQNVQESDFRAPRGADYLLKSRELRLK
jgi:hypothetical protein